MFEHITTIPTITLLIGAGLFFLLASLANLLAEPFLNTTKEA